MKWIIVIDNEAALRRAFMRMLKRVDGVSLHEADSTENALDTAKRLLSEEKETLELLLITDGDMRPDFSMDGDQLVREMRVLLGPSLKGAILITGKPEEWDKQAASVGYEIYCKPITMSFLVERVQAILIGPDESSP